MRHLIGRRSRFAAAIVVGTAAGMAADSAGRVHVGASPASGRITEGHSITGRSTSQRAIAAAHQIEAACPPDRHAP